MMAITKVVSSSHDMMDIHRGSQTRITSSCWRAARTVDDAVGSGLKKVGRRDERVLRVELAGRAERGRGLRRAWRAWRVHERARSR